MAFGLYDGNETCLVATPRPGHGFLRADLRDFVGPLGADGGGGHESSAVRRAGGRQHSRADIDVAVLAASCLTAAFVLVAATRGRLAYQEGG